MSFERGLIRRRWKSVYGEIDVIAVKDENIIFFEIKYSKYRSQALFLTERQKSRCANAALDFLSKFPTTKTIRFDYIFVHKDKNIEHIQNAFFIEEYSSKL